MVLGPATPSAGRPSLLARTTATLPAMGRFKEWDAVVAAHEIVIRGLTAQMPDILGSIRPFETRIAAGTTGTVLDPVGDDHYTVEFYDDQGSPYLVETVADDELAPFRPN